jgi:hypothetical protein
MSNARMHLVRWPAAARIALVALVAMAAHAAPSRAGSGSADAACPCATHPTRVVAAQDAPLPSAHEVRRIEGWTVRVDTRLVGDGADPCGPHALRLLANRLYEIAFVLPKDKVARLREVVIQIDLAHGELVSAQYHPSREWLVGHGYSAELARCVHIPDAREWSSHGHQTVQPWSVLHELAHAYHDQVLGFDDATVVEAWEKFRADARHGAVLHIGGGREPHYALTNEKEFFAEMTESYFGANDFEPFNRAQLAVQEPAAHALMERIWGRP